MWFCNNNKNRIHGQKNLKITSTPSTSKSKVCDYENIISFLKKVTRYKMYAASVISPFSVS